MTVKKTSLNDIATKLGVSKTLVSMVLNNKGNDNGISKETQKRVKDLAEKLNYKPNLFARGLRIGKSNIIGLIVADISNPFYAKIARKVEDYCNKFGFNIIVCSSDEKNDKESNLIQVLKYRQVDGLIISTTQDKTIDFEEMHKEDYPFVLIDRDIENFKANKVMVNNKTGSLELMNHLLEQKHENIALLKISPNYLSTIKQRSDAYIEALTQKGFNVNDNYIFNIPFNDVENSTINAIEHIIKNKPEITALFVTNNNLAVAALKAFNKFKVNIPNDMAFASFDDIDLFQITSPTITSVAQPIDDICKSSVEILINRINNPDKPKLTNRVLDTELIIRESTIKK